MATLGLSGIAHRRFDPLRGSWVLIASPHKNKRPRQGQKEAVVTGEKKIYDPKVRASGDRNPQYHGTFLFENDYSTVRMDEGSYDTDVDPKDASAMLRAEPVVGRCYVVSYSANHHYNVSDMTVEEIVGIIETWRNVYAAHYTPNIQLSSSATDVEALDSKIAEGMSFDNENLVYMQVFDNNGPIVGASNPHPHGQIWITSSMPDEPKRELAQMKKYRENNGGAHLLGDYVRLEMDREERIVWQNAGFLAVCPWWAVWPYEILLVPKRQIRSLVDMNQTERLEFAEAMLQVNRAYDNLFGMTFPYISALHQAPLNSTDIELKSSYLHMHFSPPLLFPSIRKFFGGYELYGEPTREITPEAAAAQLRVSLAQLSACSVDGKPYSPTLEPVESIVIGSRRMRLCSRESSSWWQRLLRKVLRLDVLQLKYDIVRKAAPKNDAFISIS